MDTFEQDLRRRLARRDPGDAFTARVMAGVASERRPKIVEMPRRWARRWALVGAVAAALAAGVFVWQDESAAPPPETAQAVMTDAEAEAQLLETLFVTGAKINQARNTVWGSAPPREAARGEK